MTLFGGGNHALYNFHEKSHV